jgi:peroxiredoxin
MARITARHLAIGVIAVIVTVGGAYILGTEAAQLLTSRKERAIAAARAALADRVINDMGTIKVGDVLGDSTFLTLTGERVKLSQYLDNNHPTVITIFDPTCQACLLEFEDVAIEVSRPDDFARFVLVSPGEIDQLVNLQRELGLKSPILHDDLARFSSTINLRAYPFSIVVDRSRTIRRLIAGAMTRDEIAGILRE